MAKKFYLSGWNVFINGLNHERLKSSLDNQRLLESKSKAESFPFAEKTGKFYREAYEKTEKKGRYQQKKISKVS